MILTKSLENLSVSLPESRDGFPSSFASRSAGLRLRCFLNPLGNHPSSLHSMTCVNAPMFPNPNALA